MNETTNETKPWIPPFALVAALLAHGLSWLLLALTRWPDVPGLSFPALAWIHLVSLGWLTLTALAIMVHVIPGFLDTDWELEGVARWALLPFGIGTVLLVSAFLGIGTWAFQWGAGLLIASLMAFMVPAMITMIRYRAPEGTKVPYRFAFTLVLSALAIAAVLGGIMAWALAGAPWPHLLQPLLPIHALLAGGGWLSMLILGVSTRTVFPVTGRKRFLMPFHVIISAGFTGGLILLLVGLVPGLEHAAWRWAGLLLTGVAAVLYLVDVARLLWRAPNPNRPPQAFIAASLVYFVATVALGAGVNAGLDHWQAALAFVALVGWIGQSVNGYLLHIGMRLMLTILRGDEDETPPAEVVSQAWSWSAFALFQVAIVWGTAVLFMGQGAWLPVSGVLGLLGWFWLMGTAAFAYRRARAGHNLSFPNP